MSILGTGAAASVAQTSLNAQQQARQSDKARGTRQRAAADAAAEFVDRLNGPADADDPAGDLPDRGALGYELLYGPDGHLQGGDAEAATGEPGPEAPPRGGLDVTG